MSTDQSSDSPNILVIVSDQERSHEWLPEGLELPARDRLREVSVDFTNHFTNSSPCSPSRASLVTGMHVPRHGVTENSTYEINTSLPVGSRTLGTMLREQGYDTGFIGKWHLQPTGFPDMESYGFGGWWGDDRDFLGLPGSGTTYDLPIAQQAARWLAERAESTRPWFLIVGLVNPHDVMWFPVDQPWYAEMDPEGARRATESVAGREWSNMTEFPIFDIDYEERFDQLPANFDDDLLDKPEVHRRWMFEMGRRQGAGTMPRDATKLWLRHLDYYAKLHELSDISIGTVLEPLETNGLWDSTAVLFTSDHGDQCGSHGLRSKGPWNYQETMKIPLMIHMPEGRNAGSSTPSLTSHVDVAATVADLAGVDLAGEHQLQGASLVPLVDNGDASVNDHVLFAQDWAWYEGVEQTRYASRGLFDGRYKYCRYYGVGGSTTTRGQVLPGEKLFDADSAFEDQEHELYDLQEDPGELVNLAHDRGRRSELREWFEQLRQYEAKDFD